MKFLLYIILVICCMGCRSVQYVPEDSFRLDSVYINRFHTDSIYCRDSIFVHDRGDTVTVFKDRYIYKSLTRKDTLYISKTDSVSVPYPVEKKLTAWQQVKVNYGGYAMLAVFVFILIVVGHVVYKLKK